MGGKRLIDMSYTTSESAEVRPRSFNRKSGLNIFPDVKDDQNMLNGKYSVDTEDGPDDADTWSIEHDLPSSVPSAKFGRHHQQRQTQHDSSSNGDFPVQLDFKIGSDPRKERRNEYRRQKGLPEIGESFAETTDEEFMNNCMNNISSASSSISWAEDAVEAELTRKIFGLWEDCQKVITGEITERPDDMLPIVFEECMDWRRVFPIQNLERFSRYNEEVLTPTPTNNRRNLISSLSSPNYKSSTPDSPNPPSPNPCLTPNPEKNSHYVSLWLSDCQSRVPAMGSSQEDHDGGHPAHLKSLSLSDTMESRLSTPNHVQLDRQYRDNNNDGSSSATAIGKRAFTFDSNSDSPHPHHPRPATSTSNTNTNPINSNTNGFHLPYAEPDPTNFFTSLALDNVMNGSNTGSSNLSSVVRYNHNNQGHPGRFFTSEDGSIKPETTGIALSDFQSQSQSDDMQIPQFPNVAMMSGSGSGSTNKLRVQRPISSNVKGHLITPLSTKFSHPSSSLSLSRSFREQRGFSSSGQTNSSFPFHSHHYNKYPNHEEEEEDSMGGTTAAESSDASNSNFPPFLTSTPMSMFTRTRSPNRSAQSHSTVTSLPVFLPAIQSSSQGTRGSAPHRPFSKSTRASTNTNMTNYNNNNNSGSFSVSGSGNNNNYGKGRVSNDFSSGSGDPGMGMMMLSRDRSSLFSAQSKGPMQNNFSTTISHSTSGGSAGSGSASSGSGFNGGIGQPNWSRHSSISDNFSFKVQNNSDAGATGKSGGNGAMTTVDGIGEHYFSHQMCPPYDLDLSVDPSSSSTTDGISLKLQRPHFLPVEADLVSSATVKSKSMSRPFLYWLLDKVSPS